MRNKIYCMLVLMPILLFAHITSFAQADANPDSFMRSNNKIYVVCAICVTILVGLFLYVASIDRKIGKMEKENFDN